MNQLNTRQTLLIRLRDRHDERSWQEFHDYYSGYIFAVLKSMNVKPQDSEDIVQSVLLKSWEKLPEFEYSQQKGRFRGWLATVTKNMATNFLKRKTRELTNIEDPVEADEERQYLSGIALPEIDEISVKEWKLYIANLAWENIKNHFSAESIEAFLLLADDMSPRAVSEKTGIPIDNLYVYKARIRKRLTQEIRMLEDELG